MLILTLFIGIWRGIFSIPSQEIPINFELITVQDSLQVIFYNDTERLVCKEVRLNKDSLFITMPMYDSEFRLRVRGREMEGVWINHLRKGSPEIPFHAAAGNSERFSPNTSANQDIGGRWEAWFMEGADSSIAIGQFIQKNHRVSGTFLTESGDHRYLEGIVRGDSLLLSVFDGFFCRLYAAEINGNSMKGMFYSGNTFSGAFHAVKKPTAKLRDAGSISSFEGKPKFTLPDIDSNLVSLSDPEYKNKVIILQIMGTWCPNCMDESEFLASYFADAKDKGVRIIGLSFERTLDFNKAAYYLKRTAERFNVNYPLLYAGTIGSGNVEKVLNGLKNFSAYPTTIFIGKDGNVKHIHAGFNGPASGEAYEKYKSEFYRRMHQLLAD